MGKKIILWGVGLNAEYIYDTLLPECEVVALVDTDTEKQSKVWKDNLIITGPEVIKRVAYDYIIVTPQSYASIEQQITAMGINEKAVIYYWKDEVAQDIFESRSNKLLEERNSKNVYRARLDSAPYEWGLKPVPVIESGQDLLKTILKEKKSLSRFGDGEFEIMRGNNRAWFQSKSDELARRLLEIFRADDKSVVIAAAQNFIGLDELKEWAADDIRLYMEGQTREDIISFFNPNQKYYDAYVSRPYLLRKTPEIAQKIFSLFKQIWKNRDIFMVEGEYGRTGVANGLFEGAKSIRRIVCPAINAWSSYDKILNCVMNNVCKEDLICISLGPTASVLAYDLAKNGYQALDIGQLDNEYEWYLRKAEKRISIKGKMVAEVNDHYEKDESIDMEYETQVMCRVV